MSTLSPLNNDELLPISIQRVPQEDPFSIEDGQLQQNIQAEDVSMISSFPEVDPQWFYDGLPGSLASTSPLLEGDPIDFVPVPFYVRNGPFTINLGPPSDPNRTVGFLDGTMRPINPPIRINGIPTGAIIFYQLFNPNYFRENFPETQIVRRDHWSLLADFGGIDPGSTASQTIQLTYGFSTTETMQFAIEVGATIGGSGNNITGSLSVKVSESFSTSITFSEQLSISTTVNYVARPFAQRIGLYQLCSDYQILPGPAFQEYSDGFLNAGTPIIPMLGRRAPFTYTSNRYQKVFVLEPQEQ